MLFKLLRDEAGTSDIEFGQVSRNLRKIKSKIFASSPVSGEEVIAAFEQENIMASFG